MALRKKKGHSYGDNSEDLRAEILDYSKKNAYPSQHYADATCKECGSKSFHILLDDTAGCAERVCVSCTNRHYIGDSAEYADEAELEECACPCGKEDFEVSVGVHLYDNSHDVKWIYIGLRCVTCGLVAVYGDWKNEYESYTALLALV